MSEPKRWRVWEYDPTLSGSAEEQKENAREFPVRPGGALGFVLGPCILDPDDAAEHWAETQEQSDAEYPIGTGAREAIVYVEDLESGKVTKWRVTGESVPSYSANLYRPRCRLCQRSYPEGTQRIAGPLPECKTCGKDKAPRGRDVAAAEGEGGYCSREYCEGHYQPPHVGVHWPGEVCAE